MTRRTFQKQAALFVMGCALQVCGLLPRVKLPAPEAAKSIPNPAWKAATHRVYFIWNREAIKAMGFVEV